jgi:hypothetical protein
VDIGAEAELVGLRSGQEDRRVGRARLREEILERGAQQVLDIEFLREQAAELADDLRLVALVLETFRSNFPRSGNPVGLNSEITATLTGQNQLRLALIPPNHPAINREGELTDRWGTPFFFHAESATRMTITSAGPDKKLHTPDDESFAP